MPKNAESEELMAEYIHISHTFSPVYDSESRILILGSFPSVKSREQGFYYGHPRNRFWRVMAAVCGDREPHSTDEKKRLLKTHHIALWDVIDSCDIKGSSDSSIKNVLPADIAGLISRTGIKSIYANGRTAGRLYEKYIEPQTGINAVVLPSTSPANAASSLDALIRSWGAALQDTVRF